MTPIFPLNSVLCPGGRIPLQIFEPRYIDMITQCLKAQESFVIALLKQGSETDTFVEYFNVGTTVFVQDFNQLPNGLLGVTVEGVDKVEIVPQGRSDSGIQLGEVTGLMEEAYQPLPGGYSDIVSLLKRLMHYPAVNELNMVVDWGDARHIGWRLTELLPIPIPDKQRLLEINDPLMRLEQVGELLTLLEG